MRKGLTEIVFILDRSGSMSGLEGDTIGGYNSLLAKQKQEVGSAVCGGNHASYAGIGKCGFCVEERKKLFSGSSRSG